MNPHHHALAKDAAERAAKNARVAPELLFAPILSAIQDAALALAAQVNPGWDEEATITPGPWVARGRFVYAYGSTDTYAGAVEGAIFEALDIEASDVEGRTWSTSGSPEENAAYVARLVKSDRAFQVQTTSTEPLTVEEVTQIIAHHLSAWVEAHDYEVECAAAGILDLVATRTTPLAKAALERSTPQAKEDPADVHADPDLPVRPLLERSDLPVVAPPAGLDKFERAAWEKYPNDPSMRNRWYRILEEEARLRASVGYTESDA